MLTTSEPTLTFGQVQAPDQAFAPRRDRLRAVALDKSFLANRVLKRVSLSVAPGKVHTLMGENDRGIDPRGVEAETQGRPFCPGWCRLYATVGTSSAPRAQQGADRFQLIQNFREAIEKGRVHAG